MFRLIKNGAVNVIHVEGPINAEIGADLREFVSSTFTTGRPMTVFDLGGVPLLDSNGIEALCDVNEQHNRCGGQLKLARPQALIADILSITGVDKEFDLHDDVSAAVATFLR